MTFLQYFNEHTQQIRLVDKNDSWLMKTAAFFLTITNALHITNIKDDPSTERDESFMGGYGTTIGISFFGLFWILRPTIYDNPGWNWHMGPTPFVVHELTHTIQPRGLWMAVKYLLSSRWRMFYESEAIQAEVLCFPDVLRNDTWMRRRISQFNGYGIDDDVMIRQMLEQRIEEAEAGNPRASAKLVHETYLAWRDKHGGTT